MAQHQYFIFPRKQKGFEIFMQAVHLPQKEQKLAASHELKAVHAQRKTVKLISSNSFCYKCNTGRVNIQVRPLIGFSITPNPQGNRPQN